MDQHERARELAAFLRSRRERLKPVDVGLPAGGRRRTPGLRREEVATLAAVGTTWYTWLEQGRPIHPSPEVLEAIGRALLLDPTELRHLLALGGHRGTAPATTCPVVNEATQLMLDALAPNPAVIQDQRYNLLAWNSAYRFLVDDVERFAPEDRNVAWLHFTDPDWGAANCFRPDPLPSIVAKLRANWADSMDDPEWPALLSRLHAASTRFTALWEANDVLRQTTFDKVVRSSHVGELELFATTLAFENSPRIRLLTYTPRTPTAAVRLRQLQDLIDTGRLGAEQPDAVAV